LGESLRHLLELTDRNAASIYRTKGLEYRPRFTPLMRVLADGAASVGELTAALAITQGAVSQTLNAMASAGLVERRRGDDARRSVVSLTPKGRSMLAFLRPHWAATLRAVRELEVEVGFPLRSGLSVAAEALTGLSFAERIERAKRSPHSDGDSYFRRGSKEYALSRPQYPDALVEALSNLCGEHGCAVDIGCGTGQLSRLLATRFQRVLALDASESQLEEAESTPGVRFMRGRAEDTGLDDGCADLITAAQAAHWFEPDAFVGEVRRIARPGALVALITYGVPRLEAEVSGPFQRGYWQQIHRFWPTQRRHVEDGYAALPFPFDPVPFPELEIEKIMDGASFQTYLQTWSARENARQRGEEAVYQRWVDDVARAWGPPERTRQVRWPLVTRAGFVQPPDNE
jgi:DNA-binding MarR family transcriptional regulator/SAM-dependent methyltransferase